MALVGLVGFIGSGKGTVAGTLVKNHGYRADSFAASLKDACSSIFDWPRELLEGDTIASRKWREQPDAWWGEKLGIENFTPRFALQHMGTDVLRQHFNPNIWFLTLENRYRKSPEQHVVISDVRFQNEVKFIQENNGILVRVIRGEEPWWFEGAKLANNGDILARQMLVAGHIHESEWAWVGSHIDYEIHNNGSLELLENKASKINELFS